MESDSKETEREDVTEKRKVVSEDKPKTEDQWISKGYSAASKIRPRKSV